MLFRSASGVVIEDGHAVAPDAPGLGIDWLWDEIELRGGEKKRIQ